MKIKKVVRGRLPGSMTHEQKEKLKEINKALRSKFDKLAMYYQGACNDLAVASKKKEELRDSMMAFAEKHGELDSAKATVFKSARFVGGFVDRAPSMMVDEARVIKLLGNKLNTICDLVINAEKLGECVASGLITKEQFLTCFKPKGKGVRAVLFDNVGDYERKKAKHETKVPDSAEE